MVRSSFAGLFALALFGMAGGCSAIVETDVKAGIGASCKEQSECQGENVDCSKLAPTDGSGICTATCNIAADCPDGSVCSANRCSPQLKIGAIYIGNSGEGWTKTHADGLAEVSAALSYPVVTANQNVIPGPDTQKLVRDYIAAGNKVILATSTSYNADIVPLAKENPDVKFLVCEGTDVTENLGSYYGRREQAWFLAGRVAAKASTTNRLGVVGTFVSPDNVRNINAFLLGAKKEKPAAKVEVRWSGFWFDYTGKPAFGDADPDGDGLCTDAAPCYLEEYLTDKLIAGGADVVTHLSDVDRAVKFVETYNQKTAKKVLSVANNNRYGCHLNGDQGAPEQASCLTAVYWNWTPLYTQLFQQMEYGSWQPSNIYLNIQGSSPTELASSIVGLEQSAIGKAIIPDFDLFNFVSAVQKDADPYAIFSGLVGAVAGGPYNAPQRKAGPVTGPLSEKEVLSMCWFADGVVEMKDDACAVDPSVAADCTQQAAVPVGDRSPYKALPPFGETGNEAFNCAAPTHGGSTAN